MADRKWPNGVVEGPRQNGSRGGGHSGGLPPSLADADLHQSLCYILAMLKPLSDIAKMHELELLAHLMEMAVLEAAELESKHRPPRSGQSATA